ncbi:MAG: ABC transporter substrate-binding protein [Aeromicrobium erythreum]
MTYYTDANNLKLDVENGKIDVAYRSLTPTDIASLEKKDGVKVHKGPGGELRYIVLQPQDDAGQGRRAEDRRPPGDGVLDRPRRAVQPGVQGHVHAGVLGGPAGPARRDRAVQGAVRREAGQGEGQEVPRRRGRQDAVDVKLQYNPDHYGSNSDQEYNMVKRQLEATGLFTVDLQSTEWNTYSEERVKDAYPVFQLGWFPDFPDADNYLTPFFAPDNFLQSHYEDDTTTKLLDTERTEPDKTKARGRPRQGPGADRPAGADPAAADGRPGGRRR